jgi:hypothetical protein
MNYHNAGYNLNLWPRWRYNKYCYKYCYSDSRKLWAVMKGGGLALQNLFQPTISLQMPVPRLLRHTLINKYFWHFCWHLIFIHFTITIRYANLTIITVNFHNFKASFTIRLKSGSLRFSQFSGWWLILSVYILQSFDFPFVRLFGVR